MGKYVRRVKVLTGVALTGLMLAGCAGNDGGLSDSQPAPAAPEMSAGVGGGFQREGLSAQAPSDQASAQRQEIVTGRVSITADDPVDTGQQIVTKVESENGRVDDITEQPRTDDQEPSSSLTVRVPATELTRILDELHEFGVVTSVSVTKNDVTMQAQDLDARIRALRTTVDRLRTLIAGASSTSDLIEAETALSERQGELDSLTAQKRSLSDQVDLATIDIRITTDEDGGSGSKSFWDGIVSGWNALLAVLAGIVVAIGAILPWLLFVAVVAFVVYGAYRLLSRKNKRKEREHDVRTSGRGRK